MGETLRQVRVDFSGEAFCMLKAKEERVYGDAGVGRWSEGKEGWPTTG